MPASVPTSGQDAQPNGGTGAAALVTGAVAAGVALFPLLYWAGWLLGAVAVAVGVVSLRRSPSELADSPPPDLVTGQAVLPGVAVSGQAEPAPAASSTGRLAGRGSAWAGIALGLASAPLGVVGMLVIQTAYFGRAAA